MSEREQSPKPGPEQNQGYVIPQHYTLDQGQTFGSYSPRERDRLRAYSGMLDKLHETKKHLRDGKKFVFGRPNKNGDIEQALGEMNEAFAKTWEKRANTLFYDEFQGQEHMIQGAVNIQEQIDKKYYPEPEPQPEAKPENKVDIQRLNDLWNRDY